MLIGCDSRKGFEVTGYVRSINSRQYSADVVMESDDGKLVAFIARSNPPPPLWEVASRDARIAELEKAAMAQSSVGTITYTTSIGQSIPQDEWELRRKRTLAEEEG